MSPRGTEIDIRSCHRGSVVPAKCFSCWQEIKEGDRVVVRKVIGDQRLRSQMREAP
jgi:hypothetical protein